MDVSLRLFGIIFDKRIDGWWSKTARLHVLFETVLSCPFGEQLSVFRKGDERQLHHCSDPTEVANAVAGPGPGITTFYDRPEDHRISMSVAVRRNELNIALRLLAAERLHPKTAVPGLIRTAEALHGAFFEDARIGPDLAITPLDFAYPKPRPRRLDPRWGVGNIVDFYSCKDREARGQAEQLAKLATTELGPSAKRLVEGDLITIQWIRDLSDLDSVAQAVGSAEKWLADTLDFPIAPDFNSAGHRRLMPAGLEARPPLTFFDPVQSEGYKAVVPGPEGRLDSSEVEEYRSWVQQAALPDGTTLKSLHLIAPSAAAAEQLEHDAGEIGAANVYYVDGDGALWDPSPDGWWQE